MPSAMAGPLRTVIGHGGILAHLNLPVETLLTARLLLVPLHYGGGRRITQRAGEKLQDLFRGGGFGPRARLPGPSRQGRPPDGAVVRRRWRATRSRLPHTSLEHQRRRLPREVSR